VRDVFWWRNPNRSKFGRWLDREGITQSEFSERSGVSRNTIWRVCNTKGYIPTPRVMKKIMATVQKVDKTKDIDDFFQF
jgi:transcriptional regulator with XRE-family HTH domain